MGFLARLLMGTFGVTITKKVSCHAETYQATCETTQQSTFCSVSPKRHDYPERETAQQTTSRQAAKSPAAPAKPTLIKEPDDLGTPDLPRPDEVIWLDNSQKTKIAIDILNRAEWGMSYCWNKYYLEKKTVEEIVSRQEQVCYDDFWSDIRACWRMLHHPFWSAYLAGHFPSPQAVKDIPELAKEICVLDMEELRYRQTKSLIEDGVYTLGMIQNGLFSNRWRPADLNERDKWYLRKVLTQYGLQVPPSDDPDPIPFAELYIGAVFGVKVTEKKRLSSYEFVQGDEPFENRVQCIREDGWVYKYHINECEDMLFYGRPERCERSLEYALHDARRNLKVRKILAGGKYPEVRSAAVDGVDLDELKKISVKDLDLSSRAQRRIREYFRYEDEATLADLIRTYHDWLIYENSVASTEIKEYLYQHDYVVRPENMPMDKRTHIAYLGLPTRVRQQLRYPGCVETIDDLVRCCSGNDLVFSLRDVDGIGKRSMEVIRARLVEFGFLSDSQ